MGKSRYSDTRVIDGKSFATFSMPRVSAGLKQLDLLEGVRTTEYLYKAGDRLDHLAARFFNDDSLWWVIAMVNNIKWPFKSGGLTPGIRLKIPMNARDVLDKIVR